VTSTPAVRALVLDFDGLIADTEGPEYRAWQDTWAEYGHELTLDEWVQCIGTNSPDSWHPLTALAERVGEGFDADEANLRRRARHHPAIRALRDPLPGVVDLLAQAEAAGLACAIASSSGDDWVPPLLGQLGLADRFAHVSVFDGTCPAKPAPDLYLRACAALRVEPREAVAFEDSPNGIAAAKAAGLWCVAVPHELTRGLDLSAADVVIPTLDGVALNDLFARLGC
jgi:HAD superfamily hydrolase (TIGR01509 family)